MKRFQSFGKLKLADLSQQQQQQLLLPLSLVSIYLSIYWTIKLAESWQARSKRARLFTRLQVARLPATQIINFLSVFYYYSSTYFHTHTHTQAEHRAESRCCFLLLAFFTLQLCRRASLALVVSFRFVSFGLVSSHLCWRFASWRKTKRPRSNFDGLSWRSHRSGSKSCSGCHLGISCRYRARSMATIRQPAAELRARCRPAFIHQSQFVSSPRSRLIEAER